MAGEIPDLKNKARRAKNLTLTRAIEILENPQKYDKEVYDQTYLTILKNSVPRSQEITGEDGTPLQLQITGMKIIKDNSDGGKELPGA